MRMLFDELLQLQVLNWNKSVLQHISSVNGYDRGEQSGFWHLDFLDYTL